MYRVLCLVIAASALAFSAAAQTSPDVPKKAEPPAAAPQPPIPPPAAEPKTDASPADAAKTKEAPPAAAVQKGARTEARGIRERVERTGTRRARSARRHRSVRPHRPRWRHVWVYRAHDPHGHRTYEYVPRKLGGYFTSGRPDCACRRTADRRGGGW
jgi:hypothetical protein